ncbi:haloacid dehalogenase-like hydrolase [Colletotrichum kahawae]|uniref:Haloacid dehalogenase-like hydrolase n=1 Tax=Colletotrichum kahawae TaxID=34407 RepID=A0AAE0DEP9_COLKA|nr:haloacid dehalogenase-like hydrolase [Colletotrichum kahawae]
MYDVDFDLRGIPNGTINPCPRENIAEVYNQRTTRETGTMAASKNVMPSVVGTLVWYEHLLEAIDKRLWERLKASVI